MRPWLQGGKEIVFLLPGRGRLLPGQIPRRGSSESAYNRRARYRLSSSKRGEEMPKDEACQVIQGDSECGDGHYRPKKDLRNQSEEAKLHAAALDNVEDALSRESQNPVELDGTRIGRAYQEAAGIPAMLNTARYGFR